MEEIEPNTEYNLVELVGDDTEKLNETTKKEETTIDDQKHPVAGFKSETVQEKLIEEEQNKDILYEKEEQAQSFQVEENNTPNEEMEKTIDLNYLDKEAEINEEKEGSASNFDVREKETDLVILTQTQVYEIGQFDETLKSAVNLEEKVEEKIEKIHQVSLSADEYGNNKKEIISQNEEVPEQAKTTSEQIQEIDIEEKIRACSFIFLKSLLKLLNI